MCAVLLPTGDNPIAVNKYIISCIIVLWAEQMRDDWVRLDGIGIRLFQMTRTLQNLKGSLMHSEHPATWSYPEPDKPLHALPSELFQLYLTLSPATSQVFQAVFLSVSPQKTLYGFIFPHSCHVLSPSQHYSRWY